MRKGLLELGEKPSEAEIAKFLPQLSNDLPVSYINFLKIHKGAVGDLPLQPFYFQLWELSEISDNNSSYEVQNYLPDYFGIGGNGGGELLALNLKDKKIYTIPFIPMDEKDALLVAESFEEFENIMGFTEQTES